MKTWRFSPWTPLSSVHAALNSAVCGSHIELKKWIGWYSRWRLNSKHLLLAQLACEQSNDVSRHQFACEVLQVARVHRVLNEQLHFDHIARPNHVRPLNSVNGHDASTQADSVTIISICLYLNSPLDNWAMISSWKFMLWLYKLSNLVWSLTFAKTSSRPKPSIKFSRAQWQRWGENLRNFWENCNLQFSVNHTKHYTFDIISMWFIWVFHDPEFLLIRRSLVRAQVEEPPKKAGSQAVLFPFIRNNLSRWGPLGDFLPSNFIELLHVYYTVDGSSQVVFVIT